MITLWVIQRRFGRAMPSSDSRCHRLGRGGPFQWEVGMANLGIGVAGVIAGIFGREYWLAVILVALVFLDGAAVGHIKDVILRKNVAGGNAWPVLYTDVLFPVFALSRLSTWATDGLVSADPSRKTTVGTVKLPSLMSATISAPPA
jgi:hypothetical protein